MKFSAIKGKLNMEYLANDLHALLAYYDRHSCGSQYIMQFRILTYIMFDYYRATIPLYMTVIDSPQYKLSCCSIVELK